MVSSSFRSIVLAASIAASAAGCGSLRDDPELAAPRSEAEWRALVADIRAFEQSIGFAPTRNFLRVDEKKAGFPLCGHVSPLYLPYSYEDPAIEWVEAQSAEECRTIAGDADMMFAEAEAMGQSETPVTAAMLVAPLARFVYLVIHEDCHDQFDLPYGVEEALCNALGYEAMRTFGRERYGPLATERHAMDRFARTGATHAERVREVYGELAALYARHQRSAIAADALLKMRADVFARGERRLDWHAGSMNNIWIANAITYSRHYPLMQRALDAFDRDLGRTVAFFRAVDAAKPARARFATRGFASDSSVEWVRAYEGAVVELIDGALAARS